MKGSRVRCDSMDVVWLGLGLVMREETSVVVERRRFRDEAGEAVDSLGRERRRRYRREGCERGIRSLP